MAKLFVLIGESAGTCQFGEWDTFIDGKKM